VKKYSENFVNIRLKYKKKEAVGLSGENIGKIMCQNSEKK